MDAGAVDADEDAIGDTGPGRVLGMAVKANLEKALLVVKASSGPQGLVLKSTLSI